MFGLFGRRRKRAEKAAEAEGSGFSLTIMPSETAARQAAAGGDPVEMNRLGTHLKVNGRHDEAAQWFRKAAEAGNNDAMANLALYLVGQGRNQEAAEWFRRAGGPMGEAFAQRLLEQPDDRRDR